MRHKYATHFTDAVVKRSPASGIYPHDNPLSLARMSHFFFYLVDNRKGVMELEPGSCLTSKICKSDFLGGSGDCKENLTRKEPLVGFDSITLKL